MPEPEDTEMIAELIRRSGPRARSTDYKLDEFKEEAAARWLAVVGRRRRRRFSRAGAAVLALAAALGAVTVAVRLLAPDGTRPAAVVDLVVGSLQSQEPSGPRLLARGDVLPTETRVRTGIAGGAGLILASGIRVRLDRSSEIQLEAPDRLTLVGGAVYVDATGAPEAEYLDVETALGVARDIGTIFQVRLGDSEMTVQVREGRVAVRRDEEHYEAATGQELRLGIDGSVTTLPAASSGSAWEWAYRTAPSFVLEGSTLGEYLDWLGRETGWSIPLEDRELVALRETHLHGSLDGVAPEETPDLVLAGCGLAYRLDNGTLILTPE